MSTPPKVAIAADNLTAQLHYRGSGNPASALPRSAISNCFPGLEFDFRNLWRRAFEGIVLVENNNLVVGIESEDCADLLGRRLLTIKDPVSHEVLPTGVPTNGPVYPSSDSTAPQAPSQPLKTAANPNGVSFMEWSNSFARIMAHQGELIECVFSAYSTTTPALDGTEVFPDTEDPYSGQAIRTITRSLRLRRFFRPGTAEVAAGVLQPGELTQGLCAPWQNDYRECACYYWAASRPDYVNVEAGADGLSHGDMWFTKKRTGTYIPDNRVDSRLWSYDDLFIAWQQHLRFIIRGKDADES
ncbi:LodA/GoxA family CTQ-dependent oxidase [Paracidovorax oryzae]|uniref:LodA/GoxA family CTQ-dependent oxidase n=1 Tax=Paracidovorax oryzae TaxID=862720 RepID=UPI0035D04273